MVNLQKTKLRGATCDVVYYARYVDDNFMVCNDQKPAKHLLKLINNVLRNIQFAMIHRMNDKLHFLDVVIQRSEDGIIQRSVY